MLGISTSYFAARGFSIYESVRRAQNLGFPLVELGANHDFEKDVFATLKKIRQDFPRLTFTQHGYFPPVFEKEYLLNPGQGLTAQNKQVLETMFEAVKILDTKVISFHCGTNWQAAYKGNFKAIKGFKEFVPTKEISWPLALKNLEEFFAEALKKGEEVGVKVAVENIWCIGGERPLLITPGDFQSFFQKLPECLFLLDYAHAILNISRPDEFFLLGEKIIQMHLSGIKNDRDHWSITAGLNLENLFSQIKNLPKLPFLILEHSAEVTEKEILKEKNLIENCFGKL